MTVSVKTKTSYKTTPGAITTGTYTAAVRVGNSTGVIVESPKITFVVNP